MLRALGTWLYEGDPLEPLAFETPLAAVKTRLAEDKAYFEGLIDRYLLQNNHRITLILEPDPELGSRQEAAEAERLAKAKAAMSEAELQAAIESTQRLKKLQETPDPPEALAAIPSLTLADLERNIKTIPLEIVEESETQVLYHDLFTNGINQVEISFRKKNC